MYIVKPENPLKLHDKELQLLNQLRRYNGLLKYGQLIQKDTRKLTMR